MVLRSVTNNAFAGFLPLLMVDRGVSKLMGVTALTVYLVAGAVGGLSAVIWATGEIGGVSFV